jgi:predicted cobalt transporter CbtA
MTGPSLGALVRIAIVAGIIAAAVSSLFHSLATEPVIERAIKLEQHLRVAKGEAAAEPLLSRTVQRVGLVVGFLLYGIIWGIVSGLLLRLGSAWFPRRSAIHRALYVTLFLGWSVAIFPALKYPPSPPGVGAAETIVTRQALYLTFIGLSVAGTLLFLWAQRLRNPALPRVAIAAIYFAYLAALYIWMPQSTEPATLPQQVTLTFRALSMAGLLLFWGVMAATLASFLKEAAVRP